MHLSLRLRFLCCSCPPQAALHLPLCSLGSYILNLNPKFVLEVGQVTEAVCSITILMVLATVSGNFSE